MPVSYFLATFLYCEKNTKFDIFWVIICLGLQCKSVDPDNMLRFVMDIEIPETHMFAITIFLSLFQFDLWE